MIVVLSVIALLWAPTFVLHVAADVIADHLVRQVELTSDVADLLDGIEVLASVGAEALLDDATASRKVQETTRGVLSLEAQVEFVFDVAILDGILGWHQRIDLLLAHRLLESLLQDDTRHAEVTTVREEASLPTLAWLHSSIAVRRFKNIKNSKNIAKSYQIVKAFHDNTINKFDHENPGFNPYLIPALFNIGNN